VILPAPDDLRHPVLVVEDDEATCELERRALVRSGLRVKTAARVRDAVQSLQSEPFLAVVLDYRLPDGEPWVVLESAKARSPQVPVILVTAMGNELVAVEAMHLGVADYIPKSDTFCEQLPGVVERVVRLAQAEERLRRSGALFQLIARNISDVIAIAGRGGTLRYISPACNAVLGYDKSELIGKPALAHVHADDRSRVESFFANLNSQEPGTIVYRHQRRDGGVTWIESNVNLADGQEGTGEIVLISRDISLRKRAEQELVFARERAEEANRSKTEFLATISHEIRTPIHAILGMSDLLSASHLDEDQRQYAGVLRRAGSNLLGLIDQILDVSKLEAGQLELERIEFNLEEVVGHAIVSVRARAETKGLALVSRIVPGLGTTFLGDADRLRQVLLNLLENAVKFTETGEIALTVEPSEAGGPGEVRFAVADTGIGIPAGKLEYIFGDFTQADSSSTRKYEGSGLGLAVSRRLVALMGGRLDVDSTAGAGSTFYFTARLAPVDAPARETTSRPQAAAQAPAGKRPLEILVAEDSPDNRMLVEAYLKDLPDTLTFVEDGQAAVDRFTSGTFDLVLMDLRMPVMDGLTATRRIRAAERERGWPRTPILALTANARPEDVAASADAGCDAHISKPISQQDLVAAIAEHVNRATEHRTAGVCF
jgi:PAS domain S-box-containing protein